MPEPKRRRPDIVAKRMIREGESHQDVLHHLINNFSMNTGEARELITPLFEQHRTRKAMTTSIFEGLRRGEDFKSYGEVKRRLLLSRRFEYVPDKDDYNTALEEATTLMIGFHLRDDKMGEAERILRKAKLNMATKDKIWEQEMNAAMQEDIKTVRSTLHTHILDAMNREKKELVVRKIFDSIVSGAEQVKHTEIEKHNYDKLWLIAAESATDIALKYDMPMNELLERLERSYGALGSFRVLLHKMKRQPQWLA